MKEREVLNYLGTLETSLKKKNRILTELIDLTESQEGILKEEEFDSDAFLGIVDKKTTLIDEVNKIDDGFDAVFKQIRDRVMSRPVLYKEEIINLQILIGELTEKGVELEVGERRNGLKLEQKLARDKAKIKQFKMSNEAVVKYYKNMNTGTENTTYFLDSKK